MVRFLLGERRLRQNPTPPVTCGSALCHRSVTGPLELLLNQNWTLRNTPLRLLRNAVARVGRRRHCTRGARRGAAAAGDVPVARTYPPRRKDVVVRAGRPGSVWCEPRDPAAPSRNNEAGGACCWRFSCWWLSAGVRLLRDGATRPPGAQDRPTASGLRRHRLARVSLPPHRHPPVGRDAAGRTRRPRRRETPAILPAHLPLRSGAPEPAPNRTGPRTDPILRCAPAAA